MRSSLGESAKTSHRPRNHPPLRLRKRRLDSDAGFVSVCFPLDWQRPSMIHFTCDRCRRVIDSEQEMRYVVQMEIEAVLDPIHETEPADDRDHLLEIDEILERADSADADPFMN